MKIYLLAALVTFFSLNTFADTNDDALFAGAGAGVAHANTSKNASVVVIQISGDAAKVLYSSLTTNANRVLDGAFETNKKESGITTCYYVKYPATYLDREAYDCRISIQKQ